MLSKDLIESAKSGDLNKVKQALKQGADVNTKDSKNNTPIRAAEKAMQK